MLEEVQMLTFYCHPTPTPRKVARARLMGQDIEFKTPGDEDSRRALYPSNYPD